MRLPAFSLGEPWRIKATGYSATRTETPLQVVRSESERRARWLLDSDMIGRKWMHNSDSQ